MKAYLLRSSVLYKSQHCSYFSRIGAKSLQFLCLYQNCIPRQYRRRILKYFRATITITVPSLAGLSLLLHLSNILVQYNIALFFITGRRRRIPPTRNYHLDERCFNICWEKFKKVVLPSDVSPPLRCYYCCVICFSHPINLHPSSRIRVGFWFYTQKINKVTPKEIWNGKVFASSSSSSTRLETHPLCTHTFFLPVATANWIGHSYNTTYNQVLKEKWKIFDVKFNTWLSLGAEQQTG